MRCNYEPVTDAARMLAAFGVTVSAELDVDRPADSVLAPFIVQSAGQHPGALGEIRTGLCGLLPASAQDVADAAQARECRVETMKSNPTFRESWWAGRRCIVPLQRVTAWCYESGRPEAWGIQRVGDEPMGVAGLWSEWIGPGGEAHLSFCVLTVDAAGHAAFGRMGYPLEREARMPVILPTDAQRRWLYGASGDVQRLLVPFNTEPLSATLLELDGAMAQQQQRWSGELGLFGEEWWPGALKSPREKHARARVIARPKLPDGVYPITGDLFA